MRFSQFVNFLNEEITSNGKPLGAGNAPGGNPDTEGIPDGIAGGPRGGKPTSPAPVDVAQQQQAVANDPTAVGGGEPDPAAGGGEGEVPDFAGDAMGDTGTEDPAAGGGDPAAAGGADPTAGGDPNAAGGEDPNAGGDPNQQQDPNQQPAANTGMDPTEADPSDSNGGSHDMTKEEIKELETTIFSKLDPDQIKSAKVNLKGQFCDLYETIDKTIERLNKIDRTSSDISAINFVVKKLYEIRTLLKEALIKNFDNKSFVENQIILQRHMAIYTALTNIIGELGKTKDAKAKKKAKKISNGEELTDEDSDTKDKNKNKETDDDGNLKI